MTRALQLCLLITALGASLITGPARAGDCLASLSELLTTLDRESREFTLRLDQYAWDCLKAYYMRLGREGNRWAGPHAARVILERRISDERQRVAHICDRVIRRGEPRARAEAVQLAASWGVTQLAGAEIFRRKRQCILGSRWLR